MSILVPYYFLLYLLKMSSVPKNIFFGDELIFSDWNKFILNTLFGNTDRKTVKNRILDTTIHRGLDDAKYRSSKENDQAAFFHIYLC